VGPPEFGPAGAAFEHYRLVIASKEETMRSILTALSCLLLASSAFAKNAAEHERVEVAFVLDTTGSMADLIDGAKRKIWSIATTIVETNPDADVSMALVAYRDRDDAYVTKVTPLSEDIQGLYGKLIKLEADGGGDTPESVNEALDKAVRGLQWSAGSDTRRIIFLVGDAPPHMDYVQEKQYPEIVREAAARGIIVNTVQAGEMWETTEIWQEIAQYGHGRFIAIPQSGGEVSIIITPYDDDIRHLQGELDRSVVPYGSRERQDELKQKLAEKAAAPASTQVENSEYYAKRAAKKEVITGGGDLIGDLRNNGIALDAVGEADMPEELRAVPGPERGAWIAERTEGRKILEDKMSNLIAKRDAFIIEEEGKSATAKPADSFDAAVKETLRVQLN
jgi:Mg-chelatase subunit ChlD